MSVRLYRDDKKKVESTPKTATESVVETAVRMAKQDIRLVSPKDYDNWGSPDTFKCETCKSYINFRCRRHAPRGQEGWPAVYPTDFCGQHKMAKKTMEGGVK